MTDLCSSNFNHSLPETKTTIEAFVYFVKIVEYMFKPTLLFMNYKQQIKVKLNIEEL